MQALFFFLSYTSAENLSRYRYVQPGYPYPYSVGVPVPLFGRNVVAEIDRFAKTPASTTKLDLKTKIFPIPTGYLHYPAPYYAFNYPLYSFDHKIRIPLDLESEVPVVPPVDEQECPCRNKVDRPKRDIEPEYPDILCPCLNEEGFKY